MFLARNRGSGRLEGGLECVFEGDSGWGRVPGETTRRLCLERVSGSTFGRAGAAVQRPGRPGDTRPAFLVGYVSFRFSLRNAIDRARIIMAFVRVEPSFTASVGEAGAVSLRGVYLVLLPRFSPPRWYLPSFT